ncbi:Y-family DNA polymerase [Aquirhabdus sp.]|uniref:Y-family DNA polymerase n=1 Tax=Aquirhabdus sp. TaxID=2824160 RepID=UPI00396CF5B0
MNQVYALVDVNNCYVSCERVFNPKLKDKPVVVLSNNDGCVVSRSKETKELGVRMAGPWYQFKDLARQHGIIALSSNYALYGEMSNRFMSILGDFVTPAEQEIYSIDECFLELTQYQNLFNLTEYAQQMRQRVKQWIGLPVCVGIGTTKTQAKLANYWAKSQPDFNGVCNWLDLDPEIKTAWMAQTPAREVWGVGHKHAEALGAMEIKSIADLVKANPMQIKKHFSIVLARTVMELQGISCLTLETQAAIKQQIISSRTFGKRISQLDKLHEVITVFATRAHSKLRADESVCSMVTVYITTNRHREQDRQNTNRSFTVTLKDASDDILLIAHAARAAASKIYQAGYDYQKAGVILSAISLKKTCVQSLSLFEPDPIDAKKHEALMGTLEKVASRFSKKSLGIGVSALQGQSWEMTQAHRSPNYLCDWNDIPVVN